jgi:hypothetical protein
MIDPESVFRAPEVPNERAVSSLLKPTSLPYLRELKKEVERDPQFLTSHQGSIEENIQSFFYKEGIFWDEEVLHREWKDVVLEALIRLKTTERRATPTAGNDEIPAG